MDKQAARQLFEEHMAAHGLRRTPQREAVVREFLGCEHHCSPEEIYDLLRRKGRRVGFSTVYRTLKLLTDCGLAREVQFEEGVTRFEHLYGHDHHDHLICLKCGALIEFSNSTIERVQDEVAAEHGFEPRRHKMEIYGFCQSCRR
ncbi:MAG: Fur family transcriptional regulator [Armatimonadota bacterium]